MTTSLDGWMATAMASVVQTAVTETMPLKACRQTPQVGREPRLARSIWDPQCDFSFVRPAAGAMGPAVAAAEEELVGAVVGRQEA
ncbi:hypothetical protein [Leifsonia sp. Root227]|uniref:hypothetical protein n=1 Tax=Leifsonia sp. Root227 TaxID=1736496 RepID=UPI001910D173|nr:hypothetical protein [Leifsonia sp. Root227]